MANDAIDEPMPLLLIDFMDGFIQEAWNARILAHLDDGQRVFREAAAAVARPRLQEARPDSGVEADALGHLIDVRAGPSSEP